MRSPDIFHLVEISSTRTRIVYGAKKSHTASSKDGAAMINLAKNSIDEKLFRLPDATVALAAASGASGLTDGSHAATPSLNASDRTEPGLPRFIGAIG
jgi:hypothetical protein